MLNLSLIKVGCSAHVLNNSIHHRAKRMNIDIENNINQNILVFFVYTVRTEQLKECCEFANCQYMRLLSYAVARLVNSPCFLEFQDRLKCFHP